MFTYLTSVIPAFFQTPLEELPPDVVEELPPDIIQQLKDGIIDRIPEDVVDRLPDSVADKIPSGMIEFASSNPGMAVVLAIIGVVAIIGFIYGVMKSAVKVMVFSAVAGGAAWYFFFQQ